MKCPSCKKSIPDGGRYCPYCGSLINKTQNNEVINRNGMSCSDLSCMGMVWDGECKICGKTYNSDKNQLSPKTSLTVENNIGAHNNSKQGKKTGCLLFLAISLFFILIVGTFTNTGTSVKKDEAIKLVQSYGTEKSNILKTLNVLMALTKNSSNHTVEVKGWSADIEQGNIFQVKFDVEEGEKTISYKWKTDLDSKKVYAVNPNANQIMDIVNAYK